MRSSLLLGDNYPLSYVLMFWAESRSFYSKESTHATKFLQQFLFLPLVNLESSEFPISSCHLILPFFFNLQGLPPRASVHPMRVVKLSKSSIFNAYWSGWWKYVLHRCCLWSPLNQLQCLRIKKNGLFCFLCIHELIMKISKIGKWGERRRLKVGLS